MKRTNVVIDEKKLKAVKKALSISTTREAIDIALTELLKAQGRKRVLAVMGGFDLDIDLNKSRKVG